MTNETTTIPIRPEEIKTRDQFLNQYGDIDNFHFDIERMPDAELIELVAELHPLFSDAPAEVGSTSINY